jgi:hypothetical protein
METTAKYYSSIVDLPLNKFVEVLIDKNYFALVITGQPTPEDLQTAWDEIMNQYSDVMMDGEGKFHFNLLKEVELLKLDIQKVNICLQILEAEINLPGIVTPDKRYAKDLNKLSNSNFQFDHSKPHQFRNDLKRATNRSKHLLLLLGVKEKNLEAINTKTNTIISKPTKEYFYSILNTLSMFTKFQLSDSITVFSFCDWIRKYNEHTKFLESQNNK